MRTLVVDHPLVAHKLTALRDERTDRPTFRRLTDEHPHQSRRRRLHNGGTRPFERRQVEHVAALVAPNPVGLPVSRTTAFAPEPQVSGSVAESSCW